MAKFTNRNRRLPLNEAWKHYWSVLFSNSKDWKQDLEAEIVQRLCHPGHQRGFLDGRGNIRPLPAWASELTLEIQDCVVEVRFSAYAPWSMSLFDRIPRPGLSNWTTRNPLEELASKKDPQDRHLKECRDFVSAAVKECGRAITRSLLAALRDEKPAIFDVFCRPSGDAFAKTALLPSETRTELHDIDVPKNAILARRRVLWLVNVQIQKRDASPSNLGRGGSMAELVKPIVEEMKHLIDKGEARCVADAARQMLNKAPRRTDATDESVQHRLQLRFADKYRNYTSQRSI